MKRCPAILVLLQFVSDVLMAGLAFYRAYRLNLMIDPTVGGFLRYVPRMLVFISTLVGVFFFRRLYHRRRGRPQLEEITTVFGAVSLGTLIAIAIISFLFKNTLDYRRPMMLMAWVFGFVLMTLGRALATQLQRSLMRRGIGTSGTLLVGTGEVARMVLQKMLHSPHLGYQPVGLVAVNSGPQMVLGLPVLGQAADLPRVIEEHDVKEVIICLPEATHP